MHDGARATVAVTGADGQVGRALLRHLAGTTFRTVALTRTSADLPAHHKVVGPLDGERAKAALRDADYVVHLAGTLRPLGGNTYRAANLDTARAVAHAVAPGRARRILFLSFVGADETARNEYLRTKALAERALVDSGKDAVIFRCTHIVGPPEAPGPTALAMIARPGKKVSVLGDGRQVVRPVYLGDVVRALAAVLERGEAGTYELAGPDQLTIDELARLVSRDPSVPIAHLPAWAARLLGLVVPSLPGPLVDVMLRDNVGDPSRAIAAFGLTLTSLTTVWRRPS